jgi:hypothetical protein
MERSDVFDISLPRVHDICQTINPGPWGKKSNQIPWNFPCYHYHSFPLLPLSFLSPVTTIIPFPCYHYHSFPLLPLSFLSPVTTIIPFPCYHYHSFPLLPLSFISPVTTIIPFPRGVGGVGLDVYSHRIRNKKQHGQSPGQNHTLDSSLVLVQPGSLPSCTRPTLR